MRTWFITGVSRGLGRAIAQAALTEGDTVIGTVRDTAPDLASGPGKLHVVTLDVTDGEAVDGAVSQAFARAGKIDVIVNNAGYGLLGALEKATEPKQDGCSRSTCSRQFGSFARLCHTCAPSVRAISSTSRR